METCKKYCRTQRHHCIHQLVYHAYADDMESQVGEWADDIEVESELRLRHSC